MLVRDLIALLSTVDPDLDIILTMNAEYEGPIGAVYVSHGSLYLDDLPADSDDVVLYTE